MRSLEINSLNLDNVYNLNTTIVDYFMFNSV
jgi:hypothetical protein